MVDTVDSMDSEQLNASELGQRLKGDIFFSLLLLIMNERCLLSLSLCVPLSGHTCAEILYWRTWRCKEATIA